MASGLTDEERALLNVLAGRIDELERSSVLHHDELIRLNGESSQLLENLKAEFNRHSEELVGIKRSAGGGPPVGLGARDPERPAGVSHRLQIALQARQLGRGEQSTGLTGATPW